MFIMIRAHFFSPEERTRLLSVLRRKKGDSWSYLRANALLLLDGGMPFEEVARVLFLDEGTLRVRSATLFRIT